MRRTRSCGPTDTPPEVTRTSASRPHSSARRCSSSSSATGPIRSTSAPAASNAAAEHRGRSTRRSAPDQAPRRAPGAGPRTEHDNPRPARCTRPRRLRRRRGRRSEQRRARSRRRAALHRRAHRPRSAEYGLPRRPDRHLARSLSLSTTFSIGTTASAPAGTAPPVEICIASPAPERRSAGRPAAIRKTTGNSPGTSAALIAKPSMAELGNGAGRSAPQRPPRAHGPRLRRPEPARIRADRDPREHARQGFVDRKQLGIGHIR